MVEIKDYYKYGLTSHQMDKLSPLFDEMDRNARAFGWEIGRGHPLTDLVMECSPENPFLDPEWKSKIKNEAGDGA